MPPPKDAERTATITAARLRVAVAHELAFAERVLPSASNLWVQASLNQKQRLVERLAGREVRKENSLW